MAELANGKAVREGTEKDPVIYCTPENDEAV